MGGAWSPPSRPRGTGQAPTHSQDGDEGSIPAADKVGRGVCSLFPCRNVQAKELGVSLIIWGGLVKAWAVYGDPSLAKSVPPHPAER